MIDVHVLDDLRHFFEIGVGLLAFHVDGQFLDSQVAVLVLVDFHEDLAKRHDVLLRQLRGDVIQHQHLELH